MEQMIERNVIDFEKWKKRKDTKKINAGITANESTSNGNAHQNENSHMWIMAMVCIVCTILAIIK
ncbi:hypothetical protein SAMN02745945_01341 [Peptoclostridium litorale DSM 5388]|uniref:Uncharacterized protein n=1 Tax=Peptoclostridium litorale DSM 5388 TaxID=1121324 RepID=A0A069RDR4_PEPLI|nr:hypothetical protein [Peptoclostridium litorale]KDR94898.1 hypothetical protein CLIT_13c02200 [Peptoclostridium litorale DSM 5388]SIN95156.1 hypothetical protein SAMN02745945_01341 [Peptoclostridium litorale DSM 5388]